MLYKIKNTIVIGDSHSKIYNTKSILSKHIGAITAYNLMNKSSSTNSFYLIEKILNTINKFNTSIIISAGEIDCRLHIFYQHKKSNTSIEELIQNTVNNYLEYIKYLRRQGILVGVHGTFPATRHSQSPLYTYPYYGDDEERRDISKAFHNVLSTVMEENDVPYFDIFEWCKDSDGLINIKYLFDGDGVHLDPNRSNILEKISNWINTWKSPLGRGSQRTILPYDKNSIIKIPTNSPNKNIIEYNNWLKVKGTKYEKWFAPCVLLDNRNLIMDKVIQTNGVLPSIDKFYFPRILFNNLYDISLMSSWGLLNNKRVLCDYERGILPKFSELDNIEELDNIIDPTSNCRSYYCKNLIMTYANLFCYSETYGDKDSFKQPLFRCFNKIVTEKRYNEILGIVSRTIGLNYSVESLKNITNTSQWEYILKIPEAKDFNFEYLMKTTKEEKIELANSRVWYQTIDLGDGVIARSSPNWGHDSINQFLDFKFPLDFTGKTYLDFGCDVGSFCIEAKKRGALLSAGIDINLESIKVAKRIAKITNLDIEYEVGNTIDKHFDIVSCLSVLHHSAHPKDLLRRLRNATKELFIGEFQCWFKKWEKLEEFPDQMVPSIQSGVYPTIDCVYQELQNLFNEVKIIGEGKSEGRIVFHGIIS